MPSERKARRIGGIGVRIISYRWKHRLKKYLRISLIVLAVALLFLIAFIRYQERYVVYDSNGAHIDRTQQVVTDEPQQQTPIAVPDDLEVIIQSPESEPKDEQPLSGYYITTEMLQDVAAVRKAVEALDTACPILIELKSIFGNYYYSTGIADAPLADVEIAEIDDLLSYLKQSGFYLIAQVPAFCDRAFALAHQSCGLAISGGALWVDGNHCYWLDPANETVIAYLRQISRELSGLGFREVVFSDFRFPSSSSIVYRADRTTDELIAAAAEELCSFFSGSNLKISFCTDDTAFPVVRNIGRILVPDADAAKVEHYVAAFSGKLSDLTTQLVFLCGSLDTRFESYSQLRPLLPAAQ